MNNVILDSVITCRHCGFAKGEEMPIDACQFLTCRFRPLRSVEDYRTREEFVPHCSESCRRAAVGTMGGGPTYVERATEGTMSPGEIRACYRLYAAHRRSHQICAFPETILAMNDAGGPGELAVLLRLHTGLEGLAREIGHGHPNDDLRPSIFRNVGHLRKMLASFAAQLFSRGALVGR